jgi:hypothetical protein
MFLLLAGKAIAQGHDHTLTVGINIGPLVLRVALLAAVPVVAGFGILRAFLPAQSRTTNALVAGIAAGTVLLTLMLAGGSDIPAQAVVLVLVALAGPLFLILSRDKRFETAVRRIRSLAPWVVSVSAVLAAVEFVRAWLSHRNADSLAIVLYSGVTLALVGLSWFTVCGPRRRLVRVVIQLEAAVLAIAVMGGAAQATVLRLGDSRPAVSQPAASHPVPSHPAAGSKLSDTKPLSGQLGALHPGGDLRERGVA